jgi:DNA-directed RNA polymerase specialized sigma subunit
MARCFTQENQYHIRRDLSGEAMTAFCHAVYRYTRSEIMFSTYLVTVVENWLFDYCERLTTVKLNEQLKKDLLAFNTIRAKKIKEDCVLTFDEIIRIIVLKEMQEATLDITDSVEEYMKSNRSRFLDLAKATHRLACIDNKTVAAKSNASLEMLLKDVTESMTSLQKKVVYCKMKTGNLLEFANEFCLNEKEAKRVYDSAKKIIKTCLSFA